MPSPQFGDQTSIGRRAIPCVEEIVRKVISDRRERERHFDATLFADPAWDMLLDLYAAELAAQAVTVSSLCAASAVPSTTALRWISTLSQAGLIQRNADPQDRRRILVCLTSDARARMDAWVQITRQEDSFRVGVPTVRS
jgi:DNA-binding MarR family transcriptional regulator